MDKDIVIKIENLNKKFCRNLKRSMFYGCIDIARDMLGISYDRSKLRPGEFWALRDINFELKKGEALGIIGQNGSGKTTLLRLINGIFPPDLGRISVRGRMGALIAVGAGFHPHMTGRENIYLNGTILGMTRKEIDSKLQEIIDFADIGEFIDAPVSTYSSGMTVRLGFSIAIHSDPEILLADEVLAVGDLNFALKCYRKIAEFTEKGGSIILVSHSIQLVRNTCQGVIWMERGVIKRIGETQKICDEYEVWTMNKNKADEDTKREAIHNDPLVRIDRVEFENAKGEIISDFRVGDDFKMRMHYSLKRIVDKPVFVISIFNPENIMVISNYNKYDGFNIDKIENSGHVCFKMQKLNLKPASYSVSISLAEDNDLNKVLEWHDKMYSFSVVPNDMVSYGVVNPFPEWNLK